MTEISVHKFNNRIEGTEGAISVNLKTAVKIAQSEQRKKYSLRKRNQSLET